MKEYYISAWVSETIGQEQEIYDKELNHQYRVILIDGLQYIAHQNHEYMCYHKPHLHEE